MVMVFAPTTYARTISLYTDVSVTYLNRKILDTYYLTNFGYGFGGGASVGLINLIEADVHYSVTIFDNSKFQARVAAAVPVDNAGRVINPNYGTIPEILTKRASITATEFSIVLAPPLIIIKPYAAAGISYSTITLVQLNKPPFQSTVTAPMLKMGARVNYALAFIGIEYKSNTARFDIDLNYNRQQVPLIMGGDSFSVSLGVAI